MEELQKSKLPRVSTMAYTELRKEPEPAPAPEIQPISLPSPGPGPLQAVLGVLEGVKTKDTGGVLEGNSAGGDTLR